MKRIALILSGLLTLSACSRQAIGEGEGCLSLNVDMARTKAAMSDEQLLATARVNIYYADFSGLVRSWTCADAPETTWLPAGAYRVDVEAGEKVKENPALASWEQRSYSGSKNFSIVAGQATQVTVPALCSNAVSKVNFASTIGQCFEAGYTLTVALKDGVSLTYTAADNGKDG